MLITQALMELEQDIMKRLASFRLDVAGKANKGFAYVSYGSRRRFFHSASIDSLADEQADEQAELAA